MTLLIVADENIPAVEACFGRLGRVRRVDGRRLQSAQLQGADVLLVRSVTRVDGELLQGTEIRFVGTATSGVDHVDRDFLRRQGIGFASARGANANSVVEYVLTAIAAVDDALERLLQGATVGIVGYGAVGRALAARLDALGIGFRVCDPWLDQGSIPHAAGLSSVLACEIITLHPDLNHRQPWPSYHLLGAAELGPMNGGQLLINASRGEVIDNLVLRRRLAAGDGPVTVLDVWEGEPEVDARLAALTRLCTAHIAGYSLDGKLRGTLMLRAALVAYLGREAPGETLEKHRQVPLEAGNDLSGAGLIRRLLHTSYDIALDDVLLRASLAEPYPGIAFDRLRREYRIRRELAGSEVRVSHCTPEQLATIRALGCLPQAERLRR